MLKNVTIRNKLLFSFGLIIGLFIFFSILTITGLFDIKYKQIGVRTTITKLRASLLLANINEKQFNYDINVNNADNSLYTTGTNTEIDEFNRNYEDVHRGINQLFEYYDQHDQVNIQKIKTLQVDVTNYHDLFLLEVKKYRQIGNDDHGLLRIHEKASDTLEMTLTDISAQEYFFKMREREKEFVINKKKGELADFSEIAALLQRSLATNKTQSALFDTYSTTFTQILNIEKEIGLKKTDGVQGKLSNNINEITHVLTQLEQSITARTDQSLDFTIFLLILVSTVCIVVGAILAFLIARSISLPLKSLETATQEFASGNLQKRIPSPNLDEIGKVAFAFNSMADKLDDLYKSLEQKVNEKTTQLSEKVKSLDEAKNTMGNVMAHIQQDKAKIDEQKSVLDSVIHNMPVGVALLEPNGKSLLINDIGIALLGPGMDPNMQTDTHSEIFTLLRSDGSPYPRNELPNVLALSEGRSITRDDIIIHQSENKTVSLRITSAPIKTKEGRVVSVVSVIEDITKQKNVDRMKTEFISLASHQLRTPLSAIKWFTDMLVSGDVGELNAEQKDIAENIKSSAERMVELVNSLLNISRIESGRILVDPHPTDLKLLVESVVTDLKANIVQREQNLTINVSEDMPMINLDARLIRQVFINLLTNAVKYTKKGGEIKVSISKKADEVIVQVTDNGYGIPKKQQDKVFQKFFRADNVIKIEIDGTGLGLYLIKAIIESSNGRIWFDSEEGKGTTFWFSLPMSGMVARKGEVTLEGK